MFLKRERLESNDFEETSQIRKMILKKQVK